MNKPILASALLALAASTLAAQSTSRSNSYEGYSTPPADESIVTSSVESPHPLAKPSAGRPVQSVEPAQGRPNPVLDEGIVTTTSRPAQVETQLTARAAAADPDGDIVRPLGVRSGLLAAGTTISVKLLDRLSSVSTAKGEPFRSQVAVDVWRDGKLVIPAGSEISGTVVGVSSGSIGGHGSLRLRPETVTLSNGERYRIYADLTAVPGSGSHVSDENAVVPNSRVGRDSVEYGGGVGGGVVAGALIAGPAGALVGGVVGAGVITAHLLRSHPQANLESGTTLFFTLSEPLELISAPQRAVAN